MDNRKILIIGGGRQGPTFRNALYMDALLRLGFDVEYRFVGDLAPPKERPHLCLFDEYDQLEKRMMNAITYGTSHPEMYWPEEMKEPPPDQRKGPKGPRNRWGKL